MLQQRWLVARLAKTKKEKSGRACSSKTTTCAEFAATSTGVSTASIAFISGWGLDKRLVC